MSKILEFYKGESPNQEGLYYDDIMQFDDDELEKNHFYIQWLFPLKEPSMAIPGSPILEDEDIEKFSANWNTPDEMMEKVELRKRLIDAFNKMIVFYGFKLSLINEPNKLKSLEIIRDPQSFQSRAKNWLNPKNHNFLRISRILNSLRLLGDSSTTKMFHKCLCKVYEDYKGVIGPLTKQFWDKAVEEEL